MCAGDAVTEATKSVTVSLLSRVGAKGTNRGSSMPLPAEPDLIHISGRSFSEERRLQLITYGAISLILFGNAFYAYRCIFRTREYIDQYGFGDGSAIMTRLVGTFAAGFAIVLVVALATSIDVLGCFLFTDLFRPS